ncbi:MAG TPA: acyl-CoA dehydrogenase [Yinghuangia sp.]|nr:acyl-CoA dehydrogenase [Yinghuangia sp.]
MSTDLILQPTDEQRMMVDTTIRILESESPLEAVRAAAEGSEPSSAKLRHKLGDVGCFGVLVDELRGGGSASGNGVVDAALVAAERGARLQPGPYVGTSVTAHTLSRIGSQAWHGVLGTLVSGHAAATWAVAGLNGHALKVCSEGDHLVLDGVAEAVQDADECDHLLVGVASATGVVHVMLGLPDPRVTLTRLGGIDITRRFFDVRVDRVAVRFGHTLAQGEAGRTLLDRQIAVAAVLGAAEAVGAMDSDFRLAVEYAKTRIAFGRPIGSFQAVKHLLADTGLKLEMAKALVADAAFAVGRESEDSAVLASMAKAFVGEKSIELAHNCFQVFGGIGYTWEHDHHLYMRRLASEAQLFGSPAWHRRRVWDQASNTPTHP